MTERVGDVWEVENEGFRSDNSRQHVVRVDGRAYMGISPEGDDGQPIAHVRWTTPLGLRDQGYVKVASGLREEGR